MADTGQNSQKQPSTPVVIGLGGLLLIVVAVLGLILWLTLPTGSVQAALDWASSDWSEMPRFYLPSLW